MKPTWLVQVSRILTYDTDSSLCSYVVFRTVIRSHLHLSMIQAELPIINLELEDKNSCPLFSHMLAYQKKKPKISSN